jgi:hypothetical protein
MLTDIVGIHQRPGPASNSAFPLRSGAMTERFREQYLHHLDVETSLTPRPLHRGTRPDVGVNDDPAVSAIEEWRAARYSYFMHRREIEPLWHAIPDWVKNWHGVYAGRTESKDGSAIPILARTEETLQDCYDRRIRASATPEAAKRIETRRHEALAELRLALAAEKGAFRAAGLPFERHLEDDYWRGFRARIARAEAAVGSAPASSARGIEARCRHAVRLIDELPSNDADEEIARHLRSVILRIARDVSDIVTD